jgi:phage-related protein
MANEVFNLQATIGLDVSKFLDAMKTATSNIGNLKRDLDKASSNIENVQSSFDDVSKSANEASSEVKAVDSRFAELNNRLAMAQIAVEDATDDVNYLRDAFNSQADSAGLADAKTKDYLYSLQQAEKDLQNAEKAEQAAQEALDAYNQSMDKSVESAEDTANSSENLAKSTENAGQAADEAGGRFLSFADILKANVISDLITKGIEVAISQIGQLKENVENLATGFVDSVSGLAQYGDSIDKQSQKIGISAEKYQEWDAVLQHSGTSIGVLQAGMRTLRNAMDSLGDASGDAVVDQQKLEAAQTAYDNAVLTAEKAVIDYNAAVEKSGEDSDEAISKLIALEKAQNNVESAQSKLNAAMEGSTPKMSDAAEALHSLGISATDSMGNLRDEEEVFSEVITALQNMENETEKQRYATILLGRGGTELGALLNTTAEDTEKMKQRVHELNGVLSDEAVKASARFQDSLQDMTTGFTGLKNSMLQDFLPVFADVMDGVTDIFAGDSEGGKSKIESGLDGITETIEKSLPRVLEIGEQFMSMGDRLAPAIFKTFDMISGSIIKSVENIDVDSAVNTLLDALTGGADVVSRFAGSLTDLFVNSIDSLANSGGIERVISVVSDMMDKGGKKLVEVLPKLSTSVATIIEKIMQSIPETLTGENSANLIDSLVDSVVTIATAVANNIEPVANAITVAIPKLVSALVGNIEPLINAASTIFTSLVDSITQDDGILDNLVSGISTIVDSIVDNIDPILLALENVVNTVIEKLLEPDVISKIGESLANVLGSAIVGAAKVLGSLAGYSVRLGQTLGETLAQVDWQGVIVDGLAGIGAGIIEALGITEEFESGVEMIEGYIDEVKEYWETGWKSLEDFGAGVFDWFANIGESIINFADSIAQGVENITSGFTDNPVLNGIKGFGDKVGNWLGFGDKEKQISNGFSNGSGGASASSGRNVTINFTQNNTSPQALDEYEIWRQNKRAMDDLRANLGGVW